MTHAVAAARRLAALALILALPALAASSGPAAAATPAKTVTVAIKMFAFTARVITVAPGTTVVWTNEDEDPHTVTATDRSFHSAALDTGGKFSFTFTKAGDFGYFCSLHPHMTGRVIVKAN
ncbi:MULTISPECIES: cupredoxin domain-containing protein [unclassified Sphingomonas]|uniref:cupredoxin domain-containing protein n=1 Tax=unclassified Sphingomonas TaxID=196159 RepID=UPI00092906D0|nr:MULTISPECIES: cupredoxin domain-containing protein [unclassified Sphingomonas]OJU17802.1 MAG: hypothetical protein BGN95_16035 [Sphingomonas sp. 66-10]